MDYQESTGADGASKAATASTVSTTGTQSMVRRPPVMTSEIIVSNNSTLPPPPDSQHRAVHQIRLSALSHNYACVESAANRQKCSVIVVVKADGYGHGAISSALHLADSCGADAFAVATLEEGIALRQAFESNPAQKNVANLFVAPGTNNPTELRSRSSSPVTNTRSMRSPQIRIIVLGPPVGYPRCFDDYYYYNIEVMVSGVEVARALMEWVANPNERKRILVERAAHDAKQKALLPKQHSNISNGEKQTEIAVQKPRTSSATLSNVSGQDLAKEVRAILMNQQKNETTNAATVVTPAPAPPPAAAPKPSAPTPEIFGGIEAAAKTSRIRHSAQTSKVFVDDASDVSTPPTSVVAKAAARVKRRLRWHALVDSGMGRLGFRPEPVPQNDTTGLCDTVQVIQEMVNAEVHTDAPIEFYGMCTHMAEANSSSTYTNSQIDKFTKLLKRVRQAGIEIPTVSTDNSAALLTTTLTHFDPTEILHAHTRGYVRTGGAIYGQRPAFTQLRAVSTLKASVRHVAVLKKGESVGYDRAYIAPMDVRIATLTIGFADGYPRELGNGVGKVSIRGRVYPVAGNVCMDMLMVELGPPNADAGAQVVVGDVAVLWGPEHEGDGEGLVRLQDLAAALKTTQSALTCGLNKNRVSREMV